MMFGCRGMLVYLMLQLILHLWPPVLGILARNGEGKALSTYSMDLNKNQ